MCSTVFVHCQGIIERFEIAFIVVKPNQTVSMLADIPTKFSLDYRVVPALILRDYSEVSLTHGITLPQIRLIVNLVRVVSFDTFALYAQTHYNTST